MSRVTPRTTGVPASRAAGSTFSTKSPSSSSTVSGPTTASLHMTNTVSFNTPGNNFSVWSDKLKPTHKKPKQCSRGFLSKYQVSMPAAISALTVNAVTMISLGKEYEPGPFDVVCGRGKGSYNRPGNRRFRTLVSTYIGEYTASKSKLDKSMVLNRIVDEVRAQNNATARFIKHDRNQGWCEIGDDQAREKVGHAMREAVSAMEGATAKQESKQLFQSKQSDLLAQQRLIFERLKSLYQSGNHLSDLDDLDDDEEDEVSYEQDPDSESCSAASSAL